MPSIISTWTAFDLLPTSAVYLQYGFVLFPADSRTMFLPNETLAAAL